MSATFFTTSDGDIILHASPESGPKHDFRVHRFILSLASPVFKDMFSLPQPPDRNQNEVHGIPAVDVPDSPEVLDVILRFIYPGVEPPTFTDLSILSGLLSAADKYNIASMQPVLRGALKTFIPSEPFRVYIMACRLGFMEEAKAAAKASTPRNITLPIVHEKEIRHISSADVYRLVWFVSRREESAQSKIMTFASLVNIGGGGDPCPIEEHWSDDTVGFYANVGKRLLDIFRKNPCARVNEILGTLPDPPPGCKLTSLVDGEPPVDCPLQLSLIRYELTRLVRDLDEKNDDLLKRAFEKVF